MQKPRSLLANAYLGLIAAGRSKIFARPLSITVTVLSDRPLQAGSALPGRLNCAGIGCECGQCCGIMMMCVCCVVTSTLRLLSPVTGIWNPIMPGRVRVTAA